MSIIESDKLSPRESILLQTEVEESRLAREHEVRIKQLELEATKLDLKWQHLWRIPVIIARWPIYLTMGLAYIVAMIRKSKPSPEFWDFLSK